MKYEIRITYCYFLCIVASKRLSDLIRRPFDLYRAGVFDEYFMGLMNQVAQAMDDSITQEVNRSTFPIISCETFRFPKAPWEC